MKTALKKLGRFGFAALASLESRFDDAFLVEDVPLSSLVAHQKWQKYLYSIGNKEGLDILEIGSREVTGLSEARSQFGLANYTGFDYYPGHNVDVVGDVHRLSS